ncbi:MAG: MFS transporter [Acetobacterales bacterium]
MATASASANDYRVMGLIGAGHFVSHFFLLCLPPLFPLIKPEFDVSYAALGLAVTLLNSFTGFGQVPTGFFVDRWGARRVLFLGMLLLSASIAAIGFTSSYWALIALVCLAGLGNAVFHPADYAILGASIDEKRIGRAFGVHMLGGNIGFAAAPPVMVALAALFDWRTALLVAGVGGVVVTLVMWSQSGSMREEAPQPAAKKGKDTEGGSARLLLSAPMLLFLVFFVIAAMMTQGTQSFLVVALVNLHGTPLAVANAALTGFLLGGVAGTACGGFVADGTDRHVAITLACLLLTGALMLVVGLTDPSVVLLISALAGAGFAQGIFRPARDMIVRRLTPKGAMGKVFGFVSSGLHIGGTIAPVLFGWFLDLGRPVLIFAFLAAMMLLACLIVLVVDKLYVPRGVAAV